VSDVTQVQSDISRDLSNKLQVHVGGGGQKQFGSAGTTSPEAYRLYLEGRQLWYGRTPDGLKKSIGLFQQAIAADPNFALAYSGLADVYTVASSYMTDITSKQGIALADEASRKALQLDDSSSEVHNTRAMVLAGERKWAESEAEFRKSLQINPNNATAHYFYANVLLLPMNRMDEGIEHFHKALALDPLAPMININYGMILMMNRRNEEALAQFRKVIERDPNFVPARFNFAMFYASTGRFDLAVSEWRDHAIPRITKEYPPTARGYQQLLVDTGKADQDIDADIALAYAAGGDHEQAFQHLEEAYRKQEDELPFIIRSPAFDAMRLEPRYKTLMKNLGLPE